VTHINPSEPNQQERLVLYTPLSVFDEKHISTHCSVSQLATLAQQPCLAPFDAEILRFFKQLSKSLLTTHIPELSALGYWLRASNLKRWQQTVSQRSDLSSQTLALGTVLHFAPANVDTMFVYSWACALLMGNSNIVRLSAQDSPLKQQLLHAINALYELPEFADIAKRNAFITYEHNQQQSQQHSQQNSQQDITAALSALADGRVIWGGDDTVNQIRAIAAKPRSRDIAFADRYSVAVVSGEAFSDTTSALPVAERLWRDIQPYSQMACSSPRTLFFMGDDTQLGYLLQALEQVQGVPDQNSSDKSITRQNDHLIAAQLALATGAAQQVTQNRAITAVSVLQFNEAIANNLYQWHVGDGLLYVTRIGKLDELPRNINAHCQTISYAGMEVQEIIKAFDTAPITQIDRIVPLGQALDFSPVWDGYDLFNQLSRQVLFL